MSGTLFNLEVIIIGPNDWKLTLSLLGTADPTFKLESTFP